ncbi:MAG: S41 family peptidase [Flavobacteriales bacterium]
MQHKFFLSIFLFSFLSFGQQNNNSLNASQKITEVLLNVERFYVDQPDIPKLTESAIVALLEELDPHSTYIPKEELDDAQMTINGSFVGIGVRFQLMKDTISVVATIPGGPSEKLGILPGDQIVQVDGVSVAGIGIKNDQVRQKLMGDLGTKVKVTVNRKGKLLDFNITRDKIPVFSVDAAYMIDKEIGYIKLNSFSKTTVQEVQSALQSLKSQGMKSLIFDLQSNGGGLLDAAHKLADEFLSGDKLIVYSEGRAQPRYDLKASKKGLFEEGQLVILTDEYAASASEILSGAIQDWDRGLIIGRRTYGKGLVQRPMPLSDGSEIRLTIARYYTPTGRHIQKPYQDTETYRKDLSQRYLNGEFFLKDSIKLPDSLMYKTLKTKRTVYGGGGIMPDVFVALDTTESTTYFANLIQGGHVNSFIFNYVNANRKDLLQKYPTIKEFKAGFNCDATFMDAFFAYVAQEDSTLLFNEQDYKRSERLLKLRLKSVLAQDLWGTNEMFQVYNDTNEILQEAIHVLQSKSYQNFELEK